MHTIALGLTNVVSLMDLMQPKSMYVGAQPNHQALIIEIVRAAHGSRRQGGWSHYGVWAGLCRQTQSLTYNKPFFLGIQWAMSIDYLRDVVLQDEDKSPRRGCCIPRTRTQLQH